MSADITQGLPISGALWAIIYDPILRELEGRIPPKLGRPTCYADDVVVAVRHIARVFATVLASFACAAAAWALRLNVRKTVVVNDSAQRDDEMQREINSILGQQPCTVFVVVGPEAETDRAERHASMISAPDKCALRRVEEHKCSSCTGPSR